MIPLEVDRNLDQPLATDAKTKVEFRMQRSFDKYSLSFTTPDKGLSIPLTFEQYEELSRVFAPSPDKKKFEIEKKWEVVLEDALEHISKESAVAHEITQGYAIIAPGCEVRVRSKQRGDDAASHYLTIKGSGDLVRGESEIPFSAEHFQAIMDVCVADRVVRKTRFLMQNGAELDLYKQAGPQKAPPPAVYLPNGTVEMEFGSEAESSDTAIPEWYGKDVTKDKRLKNQSLAVSGFPTL